MIECVLQKNCKQTIKTAYIENFALNVATQEACLTRSASCHEFHIQQMKQNHAYFVTNLSSYLH